MAEIAADRAGLGAHRDRLQSHPREGAQIGDEHPVVGAPRRRLVDVEGIGILHQEFAAAHHAEARTLLVAEFPLDVIEIERQAPVGFDVGAENLGDHFLVGRPVQQFALVAVGDAQHFRTVGVVAAALAPEVGELQRRHQQFQRAGAVLLLADDLLDLLQHPKAQRQPGIDAGRLLPHHAGAQHQPVRDDLGLFRILFQDGQKKPRQSHGQLRESVGTRKSCSETGSGTKIQGRRPRKSRETRISGHFAGVLQGGQTRACAVPTISRRTSSNQDVVLIGGHAEPVIGRAFARPGGFAHPANYGFIKAPGRSFRSDVAKPGA